MSLSSIVRHARRLQIGGVATALLLGSLGCGASDSFGPGTDTTQLPWELSLSAHAITMATTAPYDTLQLTAIPRTVTGVPLSDAPAVTFTSSDSSVRVSATGLLTARQVQSGVNIVATTVYHGIRISDTAVVSVTSTATSMFAHLSLQFAPGDSAKMALANFGSNSLFLYGQKGYSAKKTVLVAAQDSDGAQIAGSLVAVSISDVSKVRFDGTFGDAIPSTRTVVSESSVLLNATVPLNLLRTGLVTLYASATVYGVTRQDSLQLLMTRPLWLVYTYGKSIPPSGGAPVFTLVPSREDETTLGVGAWVWWQNINYVPNDSAGDSLDVVFDDSTAASPDTAWPSLNSGGGNIPPFASTDETVAFPFSTNIRSRQFLRRGTFHWHSPKAGVSGTIIIE